MADVVNNLQTLIDNTAVGGTLTLTSNVVIASTATVSKEMTLDLNGYTIKNTTDIFDVIPKDWSLISVREGGNLTIVDSSEAQTGTLLAKENDCYGIDVQDGGTLTIESGNYIGNISSVYVHTGIAYINGGYYKVLQTADVGNGYVYTINCLNDNYRSGTAKVVITGGSFYNFDPTDAEEPEDCEQSYLADGVELVYDEGTGSYGVVTSSSSGSGSGSVGLKVIATKSDRVRQLPLKNGQLIFIQNLHRIAFDFNNTRVFYNQIVELDTEAERLALEDPLNGYYFVIGSGVLWFYKNGWIQITAKPSEFVFLDDDIPELGAEGNLYVKTTEGNEHISVWDEGSGSYKVVADKTNECTQTDIENLFK